MDAWSILAGAASFVAGMVSGWFNQWFAAVFESHKIRNAVRAEMHGLIVSLNFYIQKALAESENRSLLTAEGLDRLSLESFNYYWDNQRDKLLALPEWVRLQGWSKRLERIGDGEHPPLFNAIMLCESLTIPPLDKCVNRDTRKFLGRILDRPEVSKYKLDYLVRASGNRPTRT
ncbi:MAG: hypothetical protein HY651_06875 [Acidobacteria bacterium]|nr:hypothetical protein [Acidobacteriota bacterium]